MNTERRRAKIRAYCKTWREKHPDTVKANNRSPEQKARLRRWYMAKREAVLRQMKSDSESLRQEFIREYGGRCSCCGEAEEVFLTLEHIDRASAPRDAKGRRLLGKAAYRAAKKQGWPKDTLTILCINCNWAERMGDQCPHKRKRLAMVAR